MYFRYFIGGPSDGRRHKQVSTRRPRLLGISVSGSDLRQIAVYEYESERLTGTGTEYVYRFQQSLRREDALQFIKQNNSWLGH